MIRTMANLIEEIPLGDEQLPEANSALESIFPAWDWVETGEWPRRTLNTNILGLIGADVPLKIYPTDDERRSKSFKIYTKR